MGITADVDYPASLPNPLIENHSLQPVQPFLRTQMANGRARQRAVFTNTPVNGTWDFLFNSTQAIIFESWFAGLIADGVDWFNIRRMTPFGMQTVACRFTAMYSGPTMVGNSMWRYSCPLEIFNRDTLPAVWIDNPEWITAMGDFDIAMNEKWPLYGIQ